MTVSYASMDAGMRTSSGLALARRSRLRLVDAGHIDRNRIFHLDPDVSAGMSSLMMLQTISVLPTFT
jgi:hypothetical protein